MRTEQPNSSAPSVAIGNAVRFELAGLEFRGTVCAITGPIVYVCVLSYPNTFAIPRHELEQVMEPVRGF